MNKKVLWRYSIHSITNSITRFIAITLLLGLGTFALLGLKSTGPDMRAIGRQFFVKQNLADLIITSNYGIDNIDKKLLQNFKDTAKLECGYQQDVITKKNNLAIRIFSKPKNISIPKVVTGKMPSKANEIALSFLLQNKFHIGQTITFKHSSTIKSHSFKIVGFIKSPEYLDRSFVGQTNIGNGRLDGFATITKGNFQSPVYHVARLKLKKVKHIDPYNKKYNQFVYSDQQKLYKLLNANLSHKDMQANLFKNTLGLPYYTVQSRDNLESYTQYISNSKKIDILSNVFPVFLFAVAGLVTFSTMTRFIDSDRINIGTLKGLGYSNLDIALQFVIFSTLASSLGIFIGAYTGFNYLPNIIMKAYLANSILNDQLINLISVPLLIEAIIICVLSTIVASMWALWGALREEPKALLLPKQPKLGSSILLEKIPPLWNRLSFSLKITARNVFRFKSRMFMTILGIAGCCALLVMGLGIRDSLKEIADTQYGDIIKYDLIALHNHQIPQNNSHYQSIINDNYVKRHTYINYKVCHTKQPHKFIDSNIQVITFADTNVLKKYFDLRNRRNKERYLLNSSGAIINEKLAKIMHVKVGDKLTFKDNYNHTKKVTISHICEMYLGHYLFMNRKTYQKVFQTSYTSNADMISLKSHKDLNKFNEKLLKTNNLQTILSNQTSFKTLKNFTGNLTEVIIILIIMAIMLALIVIYNLTNINMLERIREIATLKVLGYFSIEATMYIYRETIILAIFGILGGWFLGFLLHKFIIVQLPPSFSMFDPNIYLDNLLISAIIPLVVTTILAFIIHFKIKKQDMLQALQSVE